MAAKKSFTFLVLLVGTVLSGSGLANADSIAFLRGGNVWIAGADGSNAQQLTTDGGTDGSVSYTYVSASKAGTPLLGYRHANSIGVISPDGTGSHTVIPGHAPAVGPDTVLSPNGQALTYISVYPPAYFDGDTVNVDGSNPTHLGRYTVVDVSFGDPAGTTVIWAGHVHNAYGTGIGPDCTPSGGSEPFGLAIVVPDQDNTTQAHTATGFFCVTGENVIQPKISPDGATVLATLQAADGSSRIIAFPRSEMTSGFNPASATFTSVTPAGVTATNGEFSPDGTKIAFDEPDGSIWTVSAAGGGTPTKILTNASVPAWSPHSLVSPGPNPGPSPGPNPGPNPAVPGPPRIHSLINRGAHLAKFTFSDKGASVFQCSLVKLKPHGKNKPKPHYSACRSPKKYQGVRSGRYTFFVRGLNSAHKAGKVTTRNFKI